MKYNRINQLFSQPLNIAYFSINKVKNISYSIFTKQPIQTLM